MVAIIFITTTTFAVIKWQAERVKFKALLYYIVDKEYTAPTKEDLERYIKIAAEKIVEEIFRK